MGHTPTKDDYDVDHSNVLGRGRFSTVKLAYCRRQRRHVAAKIIPISRDSNNTIANVTREFAILSELDHAHIIDVYDHFEDGDFAWITMERAQNGDLRKFVHLRRRLSEKLARKFFAQILDGVAYMHSRNIAHRDIKCDNVLVTGNEDIVKICDMGCAATVNVHEEDLIPPRRSNPSLGPSERFYGSPSYAAPEVLDGVAYEMKPADMWSVGVILFNMVSGYLPFGCDDIGRIRARMDSTLRWPRPIKQISRNCRNYTSTILQLRPSDRLTAEGALLGNWLEKEKT